MTQRIWNWANFQFLLLRILKYKPKVQKIYFTPEIIVDLTDKYRIKNEKKSNSPQVLLYQTYSPQFEITTFSDGRPDLEPTAYKRTQNIYV